VLVVTLTAYHIPEGFFWRIARAPKKKAASETTTPRPKQQLTTTEKEDRRGTKGFRRFK
jgi:hypothetical protein